jgi:hypothetical protein
MRNAYDILVAKPEGKRTLGRTKRGWGDNIRMDLREGGWEFVSWRLLAQDGDHWCAIANTVINLRVP